MRADIHSRLGIRVRATVGALADAEPAPPAARRVPGDHRGAARQQRRHRPPDSAVQAPAPLGSIIRQRPFVILYVATLLASLALFIPFVFIKDYAAEHGIGRGAAAILVGLSGAPASSGASGWERWEAGLACSG